MALNPSTVTLIELRICLCMCLHLSVSPSLHLSVSLSIPDLRRKEVLRSVLEEIQQVDQTHVAYKPHNWKVTLNVTTTPNLCLA